MCSSETAELMKIKALFPLSGQVQARKIQIDPSVFSLKPTVHQYELNQFSRFQELREKYKQTNRGTHRHHIALLEDSYPTKEF